MDFDNKDKSIINPNYSSIRYTKNKNVEHTDKEISISTPDSKQSNVEKLENQGVDKVSAEVNIKEDNKKDASTEKVVGWNKKLKKFEYTNYEVSNLPNNNPSEEQQSVSNEMTTKQKLDYIMHSTPIHIAVIVLVLLDSVLVIFALLVDVDVIQIPDDHLVVSIFHGFSIAILSVFMIEISLKIYANHKHFLHHKMEVVDAIVVVISFIVDVTLVFFENAGLEALGLLVLFRLWRVFRIINGFIVTIKSKADQRVHFIKHKNKELETAINEIQDDLSRRKIDVEYFKNLLKENSITFSEDEINYEELTEIIADSDVTCDTEH